MSSSAPEPSAASASSILQIQALNSTSQKRPYAQESEHSADRKHKKHKRETNLESTSSVIATASVSQSLAPPSSIAATFSPRKDKEKKRKRRKKKMSIVKLEIEEDRTKHKRANSLVKTAPVSAMTVGRMVPNNRGADVVAEANVRVYPFTIVALITHCSIRTLTKGRAKKRHKKRRSHTLRQLTGPTLQWLTAQLNS